MGANGCRAGLNSPEAKTATENITIVIVRRRWGVSAAPTYLPSQAPIPLAAPTVVAAPIMHWMHTASQGYPLFARAGRRHRRCELDGGVDRGY